MRHIIRIKTYIYVDVLKPKHIKLEVNYIGIVQDIPESWISKVKNHTNKIKIIENIGGLQR